MSQAQIALFPDIAADETICCILSLAWCLPTGLNTPITYFYLVFFVILLLHRQIRDDEACKEKYGSDWDRYCEKVPYRIIPYVVSSRWL